MDGTQPGPHPASPAPVLDVGVVGLGRMGRGLAACLARTHRVRAADPSEEARRQAPAGVHAVPGLAGLRGCDVVILSLPGDAQVREVVGELAASSPWILDTSTVDPATSRWAADRMAGRFSDCPILGRPDGAGAWTIPVGAAAEGYEVALRTLGPAARRVVHVGPAGAAATLKVANNLMLSILNAATAEALHLVAEAGLDPGLFVEIVAGSGAASVSGLFREVAPRAARGDFDPAFTIDLLAKDAGLGLALAARLGVTLPVAEAAAELSARAVRAGYGGLDSGAVLRVVGGSPPQGTDACEDS